MKNQIKHNELFNDIGEEESFDEYSKSIEEQSFKYENEIYEYRNSLPCYCNLLDNYNILQYKDIKIPRFSFVNEYYFKKYKIPFNELFNKITYDYILTKGFIFNLSTIYNNNNINKYQNISNGINKKNNNHNENIISLQIRKENSYSCINNKNETIFGKKDISLNKKKNIKKIFKLKFCGDKEIKKNFMQKKRGRKSSKKSKHYHSALDDDNILRKIQVHFLTFLVSFTNDYIDALSIDIDKKDVIHFKHLDYKFKKVINHESIEKLKASNIGQIIQTKVSPKNKGNENINQLIYSKICQQFPDLKYNYFNKFFKEFFIEYYYNNKNENLIKINDVKVNLSDKTKDFSKLIQRNINHIYKFRNVANFYYLNNRKEKGKNSKTKYDNINTEYKPFFIID